MDQFDYFRQEIYKRNSKLIHECIDVINEGVTDSPKTLAIKLTAILPASVLHKIARHIDHHHKGEIIASDIKDFDKSLQSAEYIDLISICKFVSFLSFCHFLIRIFRCEVRRK